MTKKVSPHSDPYAARLGLVCALGFGGFMVWAAAIPLEEGVAATGTVVVESKRQVIQHLEGGIVDDIRVREGDRVASGEILIVLKETASLASRDQVMQGAADFRASVARLAALQAGLDSPDFSSLDPMALGALERSEIIGRERALFDEQRNTLNADVAVLNARSLAAASTAANKTREIGITQRALESARTELGLMQSKLDNQMARRDQVTALERAVAALDGDIARLEGQRAEATALAQELRTQISQTEARFAEAVATDLKRANADLLSAEESLSAAQDILNRNVITAPVSGVVLNLAVSTQGGVIRPGEPLLEIVPQADAIVALVRIRPVDRGSVHAGQTVRAQTAAYRSWLAPKVAGIIEGVSADLKTDPVDGETYYEAKIRIPPGEVAAAGSVEIIPGMPMEVFIFSGRSRTTLDYLMEPISASLFKGLRTQ